MAHHCFFSLPTSKPFRSIIQNIHVTSFCAKI